MNLFQVCYHIVLCKCFEPHLVSMYFAPRNQILTYFFVVLSGLEQQQKGLSKFFGHFLPFQS